MALSEEFESQGTWLFKYRGQLPLILIISGLAVYIYELKTSIKVTRYSEITEAVSLFFSLTGLFVRIYTIGYTPRGTSGRNTKEQIAEQLNTTGIYSAVRHPLYLGNFLMWLGICLFIGNLWFVIIFVLTYWIYYERIMFAEEQFLRKKFGDAYLQWSQKTPAFIPRFSQWKSPAMPFNYKSVLKREYNGFFSLCLVFACFDFTGDFITSGKLFSDTDDLFWMALLLSSLLLMITLKFLKSKTRILEEQ